MDDKQLVARLRPLFAELNKRQWEIGDLLVKQFGAPNTEDSVPGVHQRIRVVADEIGIPFTTLLEYRKVAGTYAKSTRIASASFAAHTSAAYQAKDPAKVMAEVKAKAERTGDRITVQTVREIAVQRKHRKPVPPRQARERNLHLELLDYQSRAIGNLKGLRNALVGADRDELDDDQLRMLGDSLKSCEAHISWIRSWMKGDLVDQTAEFLRNN